MIFRHPDIPELTSRCRQGTVILVSAPFYSEEGLQWILPSNESAVEFWTRLNPHDWAVGVSDPPALLRYLDEIGEDRVSLRVHRALHAKIYQVDGDWAWIGSPNLTRSAFTSNIELVAELDAAESRLLENFVEDLRSSLKEISLATLRSFIDVTKDAIDQFDDARFFETEDFKAAVALADEVLAPNPTLRPSDKLPALEDFVAFIEPLRGDVPSVVRDHHSNESGQNRQGHVRQSYYALFLFLTNPRGSRLVEELGMCDLDVYPTLPPDFLNTWVRFLDDNASHHNDHIGYSFSVLRNILPERMGGYLTAGGGAIGTFTRMVPLVARFCVSKH